ncbi:MAG: hypothetical protein ACREFR_07550, partial [Limisphaerales bacterium]
PRDAPTGYIGPNRVEILDHNIVYDYRYELILGTLTQIRAYVRNHTTRPSSLAFVFKRDRQGWYYANATDSGWPVPGELQIHSKTRHAQILSPTFSIRAESAPWLSLNAAFSPDQTNATVCWRCLDQKGFPAAQAQSFKIIPDLKFHRYDVDLAASPAYRGLITQIRFDVFSRINPAATFRMKSVSLGPPPRS